MRNLVAAVLVLGVAGVALADTVTKTDGTIVEGDVIAEDDASVTIKCKLGELKIPKADVAKVERAPAAYDADADLEELKKDAAKVLDEIRRKAEDAKQPAKARAAAALADQVRAWKLKAQPEPKPTPTPNVDSRVVNYDDFLDGWDAACAWKNGMTQVQVESVKADYLKKLDGRAVMFSGELIEARNDPVVEWSIPKQKPVSTDRLAIEVKSSRHSFTFYVTEKPDFDNVRRASKGSTITVEGRLNTKDPSPLLIWNTRFSVTPPKDR